VGAAYEQGRYDADHEYLWYIAAQRAGRLLNQHKEIFDEGLIMFRDGRYDWSAIRLLGAAEKNHSSAASRLHAGHAVFALGRYDDATRLISRAFELAPSLAHKPYDIREEYGKKDDFDRHLAALRSYVRGHPDEAGAVTLLGYVTFYSEGPGAAYPHLRQAARLDPKSYFIPKLLTSARLASGMEQQKPPDAGADAPRQAEYRPDSTVGRIQRVSVTERV
jgi:tetratricopeptide (TPR) repeat protein